MLLTSCPLVPVQYKSEISGYWLSVTEEPPGYSEPIGPFSYAASMGGMALSGIASSMKEIS